MQPSIEQLRAQLIGAALRYAAVADWFERRTFSPEERARERKAMDAFNRVEAELRKAGRRVLRRMGHRQLILEQTLRQRGVPALLESEEESHERAI